MRIPIQDHKKMALQRNILKFLYAGGILTALVIAPKLLTLLGPPDRSKKRRKELYARINFARCRLKQRGLIQEIPTTKGIRFKLTQQGEKAIEKILAREYHIPEQIRWDGKWRMLIFDIREKRRSVRETLRRLLSEVGFVRLQDSVWVYPYPCDEFVAIVRAHLSSGVGELRSLVVEAIESDKSLREHFNLFL